MREEKKKEGGKKEAERRSWSTFVILTDPPFLPPLLEGHSSAEMRQISAPFGSRE